MEKIKEFFEKKLVITVEGVLILLAAAGLIAGGFNVEEVAAKIGFNVGGILTGIEGVVTVIQGISKNKD